MADFIKKLAGGLKGNQQDGCCGVEIKPAEGNQDQQADKACCSTTDASDACCATDEKSKSACC